MEKYWNIENNLHWVRDMVFDEDRLTIRNGNSVEVMASLYNLCITLANKLNTSITNLRFECSRFYRKTIHLILEN
jgi:predicted transposase YbfD/YdcC